MADTPKEPVPPRDVPEPGYDLAGVPLTQRARHLLELEFGDRKDFDDPRLEWRRLFSELLGTFMLVLVAAGGGMLHAQGQISLSAAVVAPGLMVMAIILFMGAVSGAHLNPVVSIAFALRRDFPWSRVAGYVLAQLLGGCLALVAIRVLYPKVGPADAADVIVPHPGDHHRRIPVAVTASGDGT